MFEKIVKDVIPYVTNLNDYKSFIYGRKGQKQKGIDIWAHNQDNNEFFGVQCKNYVKIEDENYIKKQICKDISKAEKFDDISKLCFFTALDRDVKLQDFVREICIERIKNDKFAVEIYFWEDIEEIICENDKLLKKYYRIFFEIKKEKDNPCSILKLSFYGYQLIYIINLMLLDREWLNWVCDILEDGERYFDNDDIKNKYLECLYNIRKFVNAPMYEFKPIDSNHDIFPYCEEIEKCLNSFNENCFNYNENNYHYFFVGRVLARLNSDNYYLISEKRFIKNLKKWFSLNKEETTYIKKQLLYISEEDRPDKLQLEKVNAAINIFECLNYILLTQIKIIQ